jgi:sulfoxide reductase heme-binding subunit YedZ
MTDRTVRLVLKPLVFTAAVAPAASIVWMLATRRFDAISFNAIVRSTGFWSLRFLCLTIAITPLRWLTGWHAAIRVRRMLGLFACFYGAVHLGAYVVFDCLQGVELTAVAPTLSAVAGDLPRPFFAMGYISFALMVPLAATSTAAMIRRLGGARWRALHRLVYAVAVAGVVHTYWPWPDHSPRYAVVLAVLFAVRIARAYARRSSQSSVRVAIPT